MIDKKEAILFILIFTAFVFSAALSGCTYQITHEWSGEDVPITIDYPEYIVVSGNIGNTTYNVTVDD